MKRKTDLFIIPRREEPMRTSEPLMRAAREEEEENR